MGSHCSEGTNKLLTSRHDGVAAPFVRAAPRRDRVCTLPAPGGTQTVLPRPSGIRGQPVRVGPGICFSFLEQRLRGPAGVQFLAPPQTSA